MKKELIVHPKMSHLADELSVCVYSAVGLIEMLFHVPTQFPDVRAGNVGKFTDAEIAELLNWNLDPQRLVGAMRDTGWLDPDDEHRLIIRDWSEHSPSFVDRWLTARRMDYADGNPPREMQSSRYR